MIRGAELVWKIGLAMCWVCVGSLVCLGMRTITSHATRPSLHNQKSKCETNKPEFMIVWLPWRCKQGPPDAGGGGLYVIQCTPHS